MALILCASVLSLCVTSLIALWVSPQLLHEEPYLGKINAKKDAIIAITVCTSIVSFLLLVIIIFLAQLFRNVRPLTPMLSAVRPYGFKIDSVKNVNFIYIVNAVTS